MSLGGVTEDESNTDPNDAARRRLRQRAEMALGRRDDESDRSSYYDKYEEMNGHAGGRYNDRNGYPGRRHEERNIRSGERGRGRRYRDDYSDEERSGKSSTHSSHHNGGYKYSDESNKHSDHDTDVEEKRKYIEEQEEEEDNRRNSFTPVKFKPRLEKELDSIRIKEINTGTVDFIRQQDDTPSVDFSDGGRHFSRSMSSFSQPGDSESNAPATRPQVQRRNLQNMDKERAPTPPAPLPLNIPAKFKTRNESDIPSPRPVPAPRPPRSITPSRSTENTIGSQEKLNNLSQDESVRGSRDHLDKVEMARGRYSYKKATGFEPENVDLNVKSDADNLPKHDIDDFESGRDSPLHQSRENLLPKTGDNISQYTYHDDNPAMNVKPANIYRQDMYEPNINSSKEKLFPTRNNDAGVDYLGRETPQQTEFSDSAGIDYLPRQPGTPINSDKKIGAGYPSYNQGPSSWNQPSASPGYNSGYQPAYTDNYSPSPSPGYSNIPSGKFHPSQFSGFGNYSDYPAETNLPPDYSVGEAGIDYLPKAGNQFSRPAYPAARDIRSRSRENISGSHENLSRSRENLSRSNENLRRENDFSPALSKSTYDSEILENSSDFKKPKQYKSIETEI